MECKCEDNFDIYLDLSKDKIDSMIKHNNYKSAFRTLILVLDHLDHSEREKMIKYYNDRG